MTNKSKTSMTPAEFIRLLEVYGGDRVRWPADERAAAAQLVARDPASSRLLAEAEALDRILERAPLPALAAEAALADRIVSAAQRSPRMVKTAADSLPAQASPVDTKAERAWSPRFPRRDFGAAGMLAASLAAGILIGFSSLPQSVLPALADLVGADRGSYNLARVEPFDEDAL